jgi:hypothetical protein
MLVMFIRIYVSDIGSTALLSHIGKKHRQPDSEHHQHQEAWEGSVRHSGLIRVTLVFLPFSISHRLFLHYQYQTFGSTLMNVLGSISISWM